MRALSVAEYELFGVPARFRSLVEVTDCKHLNAQKSVSLISVRCRNGYRADWEKEMIKQDASLLEMPEKLLALQKGPSPLDMFDSGVVFLVQPGAEEGTVQARIVSRSDDFPHKEKIQATLLRPYFDYHSELNGKVRQWGEGAIIRVFTIEVPAGKSGADFNEVEKDVDGVPKTMTFISSRTRLDCTSSQWVNLPECPFVTDCFKETLITQGIDFQELCKPWTCYAFLLRHPWNQIRDRTLTKPELILFRAYTCAGGDYTELPGAVDHNAAPIFKGVKLFPNLTTQEAIDVIMRGGVVMTNHAFNNIQIMLDTTAEEYEWLQTTSSNPIMTYCELRNTSPSDCARFEALLFGWAKQKVDDFKRDYPVILASCISYLARRALLQHEQPKAEAALKKDRLVESIMRAVRRDFAEDKAKWHGKGKFIWGGSKENADKKRHDSVRRALLRLEKQDGAALARLIAICGRFQKSENIRVKKIQDKTPPMSPVASVRTVKVNMQVANRAVRAAAHTDDSTRPRAVATAIEPQVVMVENREEKAEAKRPVSPAFDTIHITAPISDDDGSDSEMFIPRQDWSTDEEDFISRSWENSNSDMEIKP